MEIEWDGAHEGMDAITRDVREMYTRYPYPGLGEGEEERSQSVRFFLNSIQKYEMATEGKEVLDVGCGTGYTTSILAKSLPRCRVLGVDISPGSLDVAQQYRERLGVENLTLRELDITKQPLPEGKYVFALLSGSLHHMSDPESALRNIVPAIEPGGLLGVAVYSYINNVMRYRYRDVLDRLVPDRSEVALRNKIARELWVDARGLTEQELADSLSHPCDRAYTFREIHDLVTSAGLEFLEWCNCYPETFEEHGEETGPRFKQMDRLTKYETIELLSKAKLINLFFRKP